MSAEKNRYAIELVSLCDISRQYPIMCDKMENTVVIRKKIL